MAKKKQRWITDQAAIDTIIALGELRDGDELLLEGQVNTSLSGLEPGRGVAYKVTNKNNEQHLPGGTEHIGGVMAVVDGSWFVWRQQIVGWRRPHG